MLETDAYAAWLGAFRGEAGAILILGTGSCGFTVVEGKPTYVGGWGFEVSDEGSGAAIGREALRRALWVLDGREASTPLAEHILAEFGRDPQAIVAFAGGAKPADFARFAPVVLDHAQRNDALGVALVETAAADVSRIAVRLLDLGAPAVCLLGGLASALRPWLPAKIQERLAEPLSDAMDGAILMAQRASSPTGRRQTAKRPGRRTRRIASPAAKLGDFDALALAGARKMSEAGTRRSGLWHMSAGDA